MHGGGAGTTEPVRPKIVSLHRLLVHFEKKGIKKGSILQCNGGSRLPEPTKAPPNKTLVKRSHVRICSPETQTPSLTCYFDSGFSSQSITIGNISSTTMPLSKPSPTKIESITTSADEQPHAIAGRWQASPVLLNGTIVGDANMAHLHFTSRG